MKIHPYVFAGIARKYWITYSIHDGNAEIKAFPGGRKSIPLMEATIERKKSLKSLFGLGTIKITSVSGSVQEWANVPNVGRVYEALTRASKGLSPDSQIALDSTIESIKATPASDTELDKIRKEFKFYSPAQKSCKAAPLPKEGEEWELERTLPSGLYIVHYQLGFLGWGIHLAVVLLSHLTGAKFQVRQDVRKFQSDIERHKRKKPFPFLYVDERETSSISWHPTQKLLATAGVGNVTKLWDAETGDLITKFPHWSSYSNGEALVWSYDGEMFISDYHLFDGKTGEWVSSFPHIYGFDRFTNRYVDLRGLNNDHDKGTSHLSSSINLSPWRPNSIHFVMTGTDDGKRLAFRNKHTGEIEKVVDCDVPSYITDFAWHPKGRFIAVAFKEDNIRIIDIDDVKIVADLSVQNLIGWNPDGKILIGRNEKYEDDFVIWDALETKERPMPGEMKDELWFKRFFKNISADGLRYIRIEGGKDHPWSTNIYSVASDELLATLPQNVTSAAWSPIDGGLLATCGGSETHIWRI